MGWPDTMSSHIELATVAEPCAIRSGNYMMSNLDDRSSSDEDDLPQTIVEKQPKDALWKKATGKPNGKARPSPYMFTGGKKKRAVITEMDISDLAKLFESLSVYSDQLTTPRWNNFRCLRLSRTDRIRLNNLIWREFYTQHIKQLTPKFVKFETPSLENHQRPRAVILEGKYWKRRRDLVCVEYLRWRCYYKLRLNGKGYPMEVSDHELLEKVAGDPQQNALGFSVDEAMDTEDLLSDLVSNLEWLLDAPSSAAGFSMLGGPGAMANSPPDAGGNCNADIMQPLLLQMTPNLEEHNDLLHNILASPSASPMPSPHLLPEPGPSEPQSSLMPPPTAHQLLLQPSAVVSQTVPSSVVVALPHFLPSSSSDLPRLTPGGPQPSRSQACRNEPYTKRRRRSGQASPAPRLLAIAPKPSPSSSMASLPSRTSPLAEMASPLAAPDLPPSLDCQRLLSDLNRSLARHRRPASPPPAHAASPPAESPEYRRRGGLNQALVRLHGLLPEAVCRGPGAKQIPMSKAMILVRSAEQIRDLRRQHADHERQMLALRREVERLQTEIDDCCSKLPETGLPISHVANNKGQQWFRAYIRASTLRNSKFYVFSLIAEKLFSAYTSLVSMSNLQDFTVSLMTWLEQYCSMNSLRNHVRAAMTALCTKTSILTDPSRLPDESLAAVSEAESRPSS